MRSSADKGVAERNLGTRPLLSLPSRRAAEEVFHGFLGRDAFVEDGVELGGDGLGVGRDGAVEVDGERGGDAFADAVEAGQDFVEGEALREHLAAAEIATLVAGRGEEEVAESAEAGEGFRARAGVDADAGHFREAAGEEAGERVLAELEPVAGAGGDGIDVLQRAAELDADEVGRAVDAEAGLVEDGLELARERIAFRGDGADGREAGDDFTGESGT